MNDSDFLKKVGANIRAIRKGKKLRLRNTALLHKIDYSNWSRLENGQRDVHLLTLKSIAEALGVEVTDFF